MANDKSISRPVPVVRLIIPNKQGKVLILKRAQTAYAEGAWCLPGGKVDYGQTVEEAVANEMREEIAMENERARFLFYQDSLPPEPGSMHCINLYFECSARGNLSINPESSDWAWIGPGDMKDYRIAFRNDEALSRYWNEMP